MRRRAEAEAVARRLRAEADPVAVAATAVPVDLLVVAVTSTAADLAAADLVAVTSAAVAPADLAALVDLVAVAVTSAAVDLVGLVGPTFTAVVPAALVTSVVPVVRVATTSDRGPTTPSAASVVSRGAMEPRLGAGALRPEQAGAARSLHLEGSGTRVR
jgi:hypothetical protein